MSYCSIYAGLRVFRFYFDAFLNVTQVRFKTKSFMYKKLSGSAFGFIAMFGVAFWLLFHVGVC